MITYEIDEFPTPAESGDGYTNIDVTATLESGATDLTAAASAGYFAYDDGYSGIDIRFPGSLLQFILVFPSFESGFDPPNGTPKILATKKTGLSGVAALMDPPYTSTGVRNGVYEATLTHVDPAVPEPGTMATLAAGIAGLVLLRRRFGWSR